MADVIAFYEETTPEKKKICSYYNWPSLDAESSGCICFLLFAIVRSGWIRCIMISFQKRCGKWSLKKWSGSGNLSSLVQFVSDDNDDGDDDDDDDDDI